MSGYRSVIESRVIERRNKNRESIFVDFNIQSAPVQKMMEEFGISNLV
jgi:hypothetical protein